MQKLKYQIYILSFHALKVNTSTSKRSVGGTFQSDGVESPPDFPMFQLAETSSLKNI